MQSGQLFKIKQIEKKVGKIEEKLEKKLLSPIMSAAKIKIRDIIFLQNANQKGEYFPHRNNEINGNTIDRIFSSIEKIFELTQQQHRADNFEVKNNSEAMKENCEHNITRASTNEFFFYPNDEPISQDVFQALLEKIKALAMKYPENMHVLLATFPVKNSNNVLYSVVIYVQCGASPRINVTAKSILHSSDSEYPNTVASFYQKGSLKKILDDEITEILFKLTCLKYQNPIKKNECNFDKNIHNIVNFCAVNTDYPLPEEKLLTLLKTFKDEINQIKETEVKQWIDDIHNKYYQYKKKIEKIFVENEKEAKQNIFYFYPFIIAANKKNVFTPTYGGQIKCVTAGGAEFETRLDICVENENLAAVLSWMQNIRNHEKISHAILSIYVSQMLISNTIAPLKKSALTKDGKIMHTDPLISLYEAEFLDNPNDIYTNSDRLLDDEYQIELAFGNKKEDLAFTSVRVYKPKSLSILRDDFLVRIEEHNQFVIEIEALRIYRDHHSQQSQIITQLINLKIYQRTLDLLDYLSEVSSEIKSMSKNIWNYFYELKKTNSDNRHLAMDFLDKKAEEIFKQFVNKDGKFIAKDAHDLWVSIHAICNLFLNDEIDRVLAEKNQDHGILSASALTIWKPALFNEPTVNQQQHINPRLHNL